MPEGEDDPLAGHSWDIQTSVDRFLYNNEIVLAATSASILSVLAGYPFDSLKTRMQAYRFPSAWVCLTQTYAAEGLAGFYRGVGPVLLSVSAFRSVSFTMYTHTKAFLNQTILPISPDEKLGSLRAYRRIAANAYISGAAGGCVVATLNAPLEFVKIQRQLERLIHTAQLQQAEAAAAARAAAKSLRTAGFGIPPASEATVQSVKPAVPPMAGSVGEVFVGPASAGLAAGDEHAIAGTRGRKPPVHRPDQQRAEFKPGTTIDMIRKIIKKRGVVGLYSGYMPHLLRDGFGTGLYFAFYELFKYSLINYNAGLYSRPSTDPPTAADLAAAEVPLVHMLAGGLGGTVVWLFLFPIDLAKSVIQREALSDNPKYRSTLEFVAKHWKQRGLFGFYHGLTPQLIRSFPVHSLNFLVYEQVTRFCRSRGPK
ncbi:mitochondrial carrier domain-containing protein [Cladochytrium replicatum]|nr:mitochondrial carrier domain-containing protein [Cladochytrium replicatum]